MPPTQHVRAFLAARHRLLYSLPVSTQTELLGSAERSFAGRTGLIESHFLPAAWVCRENAGSVARAPRMLSEPAVPRGCGHSRGKGNISRGGFEISELGISKSEGPQIPSLPFPASPSLQMLPLQADRATPFASKRVWPLHRRSLQLTRELEKHPPLLVWGPSVLSHADVTHHPSHLGHARLARSPVAKSLPSKHPWRSGIYCAP